MAINTIIGSTTVGGRGHFLGRRLDQMGFEDFSSPGMEFHEKALWPSRAILH